MHEQGIALRRAAVDRLGELHRLQRVYQPGALTVGGGAEVASTPRTVVDERQRSDCGRARHNAAQTGT